MVRSTGSDSDVTGPRVRWAALRLFARHGYAAVSMRRIAAEVGVQVGALYNYIPDKQTLLFELMRDHLVELMDVLPDMAEDPTLVQLERFVRFHIGFHHAGTDAVWLRQMRPARRPADAFPSARLSAPV